MECCCGEEGFIIRYIILGAGKGTRLHPLTLNHPKCLFNLGNDYPIAQRMVDLIHKYDNSAEIIYVIGFMADSITSLIKDVTFIHNPFYNITNSIASLWFAKEYLDDDVCIINGDIVMESKLIKEVVTNKSYKSSVLVDSSIKIGGDYNVQVDNDNVIVMSKELNDYFGEYAGIIKLKKDGTHLLKKEIELMINEGSSDQWYENVLVQLIFSKNYILKYIDISKYSWTEVDCVDDLISAKMIHERDIVAI